MLKKIRTLLGRRENSAVESEPGSEPSPAEPGRTEEAPVVLEGAPPVHRAPTVVHRPISSQDLDPDAVKIVRRLVRFDHSAYLVGGCVRDLLLDHRPKDYDIGTSATPRQVKRLFNNCRIIGRRFRLAHVYFANGKFIEVATFRARDTVEAEATAEEGEDLLIREDNVFGTPEEDALRRDFTINALFYDVDGGNVLDHADGLDDIRRRLVRTIGDPDIRFREDPIRVLRAIRFAAKLEFEIEAQTLAALRRTRGEIPRAAPSRILEEINRFCRAGAARRSFALLLEHEVFDVILPELAATYRARPDSVDLLLALLDGLDRRTAQGVEVQTGEILLLLLLPVLLEKLGLGPDGVRARGAADSGRDLAEEELRPIATRLRVARKDQERCRQVVATLERLVPLREMRRGARAALLRRPQFRDALSALEVLAARWGGDYATAADTWSARAAAHVAASASPRSAAIAAAPSPGGNGELAAASPDAAGRPRKRRRSRRRGRGRAVEAGASQPVAAQPAAAKSAPVPRKRADLPPPWDDNYFFAALPSVPHLGEEEGRADRYGAAELADEVPSPEASEEGPGEAPARSGPPRRKRRPRRRRGPASGPGTIPPPTT
jgi:poly(A) polymerase